MVIHWEVVGGGNSNTRGNWQNAHFHAPGLDVASYTQTQAVNQNKPITCCTVSLGFIFMPTAMRKTIQNPPVCAICLIYIMSERYELICYCRASLGEKTQLSDATYVSRRRFSH